MEMMKKGTQVDRLDRIEDKIDKLSNAIVALARVEEKIMSLEERRVDSHERLNRLSSKIDDLDSGFAELRAQMIFTQRIAWVAAIGAISVVVGYLGIPTV
jgi:phage shock protein A